MTTPSDPSYREIPLTRGLVALVDADMYDFLMQWPWHAQWCKSNQSFYAARNGPTIDGKRTRIMMHRVVLRLSSDDKRDGDHKFGKTLDNRRSELRILTRSQNCQNGKHRTNNTSGYKGVSWSKSHGKWTAFIQVDGKTKTLGSFDTAQDAHAARLEAEKKYYGEFARTK